VPETHSRQHIARTIWREVNPEPAQAARRLMGQRGHSDLAALPSRPGWKAGGSRRVRSTV